MRRIRFALLTLVFVLALPAAAGAQLPYVPGPLVDPGMFTPPESVPPGPVGEYPEDWAKCVAQTQPTWPTAPPGIDPRAVDPVRSEPAARPALLRRPHGARLHAVGQVEARRRHHARPT